MHRPTCPRCGYDLSGIIESWADACPLEGRCSECGLAFQWCDVLVGTLQLPRWSFEHATPNRLIRTFFATLLRALIPPRLWSGLRMEHRTDFGRLRKFAIAGFLFLKMCGVVLLGVPTAYAVYQSFAWSGVPAEARLEATLLAALWPYGEFGSWWGSRLAISPWLLICVITAIGLPLAFLLLPASLRRARVRPAHLLRIQLYNLALLPLAIGMWSLLRSSYIVLEQFSWELRSLIFGWGDDVEPRAAVLSVAFTGLWLVWSWRAAVGRYLRMPHAGAVATAMVTIAGLAAALLVALLMGPAMFY